MTAESQLAARLLPDTAAVGDDGWLRIGGCSLRDLAAEFGTPLFVYDEEHVRARCREAVAAFGQGRAIYATKAFLCRAMARLAYDEGMRLDVATEGELHVALAAGVPASALVMHGNNKSVTELRRAIAEGVGHIVVDSFDEMDRLDALAGDGVGGVPDVLLRITPGVHAHTHEYIATGQDDSKFGFNLANGDADAGGRAGVEVGEHAARRAALPHRVERVRGGELRQGGRGDGPLRGAARHCPSWCWAAGSACRMSAPKRRRRSRSGATSCATPARRLAVTAAGQRRTGSVDRRRRGGDRVHGRDDQVDPRDPHVHLRRRRHERQPAPGLVRIGLRGVPAAGAVRTDRDLHGRLVGKHCESGDVLLFDARVPDDIAVGDLLATPVTGAYGRSMGSNYNAITRPPVVFVSDGEARLVIRRETFDDLLATDVG